jgi:N-acetylglutamate synthase-like GNAT family acetyltransferase
MKNILVRKALIKDSSEMLSVIHTAMTQYAKDSMIPQTLESLRESIEDIDRYIKSDTFLVAIFKDKIVATVRISKETEDTALISRFAVLPEMQKAGVGSILYEAAQKQIEDDGYEKIVLYTALSNHKTVNFYKAKGFELLSIDSGSIYPRGRFGKNI